MSIDPNFAKKLKKHSQHGGHDVWGEVKPPEKLGIHGTNVAVDHDVCNGDSVCMSVCPVNVFEMIDAPGNPTSNKKSDPVREPDCIACMACESQCPTKAIKITPK